MQARICEYGKAERATKFCTCGNRVTTFCTSHMSDHMLRNCFHNVLPIESLPFIQVPGYLEQLRKRLDAKDKVVELLCENVNRVEACRELLESQTQQMVMQLIRFSKEKSADLIRLKQVLEEEINQAKLEFETSIYEPNPNLQYPLTHILRNYEEGSNALQLFSYRLNLLDLSSKLNGLLVYEVKNGRVERVSNVVSTVIRPTGVVNFSFPGRRWRELIPFSAAIAVTEYSASVTLATNRVFVCGGLTFGGNTHAAASFAYLIDGSEVRSLPNLKQSRVAPGVAARQKKVYVFGGRIGSSPLNACESMDVEDAQWRRLACMRSARCFFNPCWCRDVLYLCGGTTRHCESFNPLSETFTKLSLTLEEESETTTVLHNDEIVILTKQTIVRYSSQEQKVVRDRRPKSSMPWSMCIPMVVGNLVFTVAYDIEVGAILCREVGLIQGEVVREVRLNDH